MRVNRQTTMMPGETTITATHMYCPPLHAHLLYRPRRRREIVRRPYHDAWRHVVLVGAEDRQRLSGRLAGAEDRVAAPAAPAGMDLSHEGHRRGRKVKRLQIQADNRCLHSGGLINMEATQQLLDTPPAPQGLPPGSLQHPATPPTSPSPSACWSDPCGLREEMRSAFGRRQEAIRALGLGTNT